MTMPQSSNTGSKSSLETLVPSHEAGSAVCPPPGHRRLSGQSRRSPHLEGTCHDRLEFPERGHRRLSALDALALAPSDNYKRFRWCLTAYTSFPPAPSSSFLSISATHHLFHPASLTLLPRFRTAKPAVGLFSSCQASEEGRWPVVPRARSLVSCRRRPRFAASSTAC